MNFGTKVARINALKKNDNGAEAVEFALVGPLLFFVIIGILYVLLLAAAQLSVARAATVGVRFASINEGSGYPSTTQINSEVLSNTPLFAAGACTTTSLSGGGAPNAEMSLSVKCDFPNPAGRAVSGLSNALFGGSETAESTLELTAEGTARKE